MKKEAAAVSRRGRIPAAEVEDRNNHVLDSATKVFLESGFAGATLTTIAKKAGCSIETLYAAYANKEALFSALITRKASGLLDVVGPLSPERDLREALVQFALAMLVMMAKPDTRGLHRLVIGESRSFPEVATRFWREGYGSALDIVTKYVVSKKLGGTLAVENPSYAAQVFLALLLGDTIMRSTLGMTTLIETKKQQLNWAQNSVDLFLSLLQQGKL